MYRNLVNRQMETETNRLQAWSNEGLRTQRLFRSDKRKSIVCAKAEPLLALESTSWTVLPSVRHMPSPYAHFIDLHLLTGHISIIAAVALG